VDDIGTATCGSGDWDSDGFRIRCDAPAPYRGEFRCTLPHDCLGLYDYSLLLCVRHAAIARTYDDLKRIHLARDHDHDGARTN
jgi:hypothetical protein